MYGDGGEAVREHYYIDGDGDFRTPDGCLFMYAVGGRHTWILLDPKLSGSHSHDIPDTLLTLLGIPFAV
tara:strand:+ start:1743 stop:1949 length:207 start_codon:yes stop_codon:yes gene_type:complete